MWLSLWLFSVNVVIFKNKKNAQWHYIRVAKPPHTVCFVDTQHTTKPRIIYSRKCSVNKNIDHPSGTNSLVNIFPCALFCRYSVFKIHWLMAALAFTKSTSLVFHSVSAPWPRSRLLSLLQYLLCLFFLLFCDGLVWILFVHETSLSFSDQLSLHQHCGSPYWRLGCHVLYNTLVSVTTPWYEV